MKKKTIKILLVEDDQNLSTVIQDFLELQSYDISSCADGVEGLLKFGDDKFDLIILDIMLPKMDGFTLAKEIRQRDTNIPIIFLTAKSLQEDRIEGLKIGADDYITKPFSTEELNLRIQAILRRSLTSSVSLLEEKLPKSVKLGKLRFETFNLVLKTEDKDIVLTPKEGKLLKLLIIHKNKVLLRDTALKGIWGNDDYANSRSMDVYITKLRKYLKADPNVIINNIHGSGFKLEIKKA